MNFVSQLDAVDASARNLLVNLTEAQAQSQPSPAQWSIVQEGKPFNTASTQAAESFIVRWLIRNIEPPTGARVRAPRAYVPLSTTLPGKAIERYVAVHQVTRAFIHASEGLDLVRTRMSHPSLPFFRFGIGAGFAILTGHARRHLWQALQVRHHPEFPP